MLREIPSADSGSCLHSAFEASARRSPEAIALVDGGLSLSYAQLDARAEAVARRLRALGAGPKAVVALSARRSAGTIAALLGVLKAGSAYCPLDPAYPPERLRFILEDSGAAALVATGEDAEKLFDPARPTVLLEDLAEPGPARPAGAPAAAGPADAAYVMYTSGSTGKPKGVVVEHGSAVNYVRAMMDMDLIRAGERALFFASLSFDVSVGEIFPSFAAGATLILRDDAMLSPSDFIADVETRRIDRLSLPTAYWHELAATLAPRGETLPACVRSVIVIGEAMRAESLAYWRPAAGRVRFLNGYGPTEATVAVSFHEVPADAASSGIVPIGLPGAGAGLRVIDPEGRPVPDGTPGELWIGGPGVARGYLNRAELTAERFVPDAFSGRPGTRMYRTGDRVLRRPDGVFEYLGRFDDQVKIRGFRVELGEVESALAAHPSVRTCAVVLREVSAGDKRLIAYVTSGNGEAPSGPALRAFLLKTLPEYMVPAAVVALPALPLTPNGKIDRRALPAPALEKSASADDREPAPLERQIRAIWEEVLGISPIGLGEDFFALGGHSLLAVRMLALIEKSVGIRPSMEALVGGATIERLAKALGSERSIIRFGPEAGAEPIFFVHPGLGGLYCRELSRAMPDRPVYLLVGQDLSGPGPIPSIEDMARRHVERLRTVSRRGPYRLGGYSIGGMIAYEMARQLEAAGERVSDLLLVAPPTHGFSWWWGAVRRAVGLIGGAPGEDKTDMLKRFYLWGKSGEIAAGVFERGGARRIREALRRAFTRATSAGTIREFGPNSAEVDLTLKALLWAGSVYRFGSYRGRVTLLEVKHEFLRRGAHEFRRLASSVERIPLPGTHDTIVTTHAPELGAAIGRRLSGCPLDA